MTEHYKSTPGRMQELDDIISANCNWPLNGTTHWADSRETIDSGVGSIPVPQGTPKQGLPESFTKAQMNNGISDTIYTDVEFPEVEEA